MQMRDTGISRLAGKANFEKAACFLYDESRQKFAFQSAGEAGFIWIERAKQKCRKQCKWP
jgi:hypothetical protein